MSAWVTYITLSIAISIIGLAALVNDQPSWGFIGLLCGGWLINLPYTTPFTQVLQENLAFSHWLHLQPDMALGLIGILTLGLSSSVAILKHHCFAPAPLRWQLVAELQEQHISH